MMPPDGFVAQHQAPSSVPSFHPAARQALRINPQFRLVAAGWSDQWRDGLVSSEAQRFRVARPARSDRDWRPLRSSAVRPSRRLSLSYVASSARWATRRTGGAMGAGPTPDRHPRGLLTEQAGHQFPRLTGPGGEKTDAVNKSLLRASLINRNIARPMAPTPGNLG